MTDGIKELDRSGGFYVRNYFGVKIVMDKHPLNPLVRAYAIWAIRHPNKKMREMTNADTFEWYFENVMKERREAVKEYLSNSEIEFIPRVENPDPTQLEKLKEIPAGRIRECIRECMMKEEEE